MGLETRKYNPKETNQKAKIEMPNIPTTETVEILDDKYIESLDKEEILNVSEDAETVKDPKASLKLVKARKEASTLAIGLAAGGSDTAEKMGKTSQEVSEQEITSLGGTEEAKRSVNLAKQKFAKKLESSSRDNVLMEIEMELENKTYALEDAQEDNQESVARGLQMEINALKAVEGWISANEYKKAA